MYKREKTCTSFIIYFYHTEKLLIKIYANTYINIQSIKTEQ